MSSDLYSSVGPRVQALFAKQQVRGVFVGMQWNAAVAGGEAPWKMEQAYKSMIPRSRKVGRVATRQLLLRMKSRFPQARIEILSHSMGCEVGMAALFPQLKYPDTYGLPRPTSPANRCP